MLSSNYWLKKGNRVTLSILKSFKLDFVNIKLLWYKISSASLKQWKIKQIVESIWKVHENSYLYPPAPTSSQNHSSANW